MNVVGEKTRSGSSGGAVKAVAERRLIIRALSPRKLNESEMAQFDAMSR